MRPETIKISEESIGNDFSDICCNNIFLDMATKARETNAKQTIGTTSK